MWQFEFACKLDGVINQLSSNWPPRDWPETLHHYTKAENALAITISRVMHATCLETLDDQTELDHGINMLIEEIRGTRHTKPDGFIGAVLQALPNAVRARKGWTFVACFCEGFNSSYHRRKYGDFCLQIPGFSADEPFLRAHGLYALSRLSPVIYDKSKQRRLIRNILNATIHGMTESSDGTPIGPWRPSIVAGIAGATAQHLIDLIARMKHVRNKDDQEWRVVCRPRFLFASSAPDLDDRRFAPLVKARNDGRRYVELSMQKPMGAVVQAHAQNQVPFNAIYFRDGKHSNAARQIRQLLDLNDRSDVPLIPIPANPNGFDA